MLAAKSTPRLDHGVLDLNGAWDHWGGIEFVQPVVCADGSVCVLGCGTALPADEQSPGTYTRTFPRYKPEFLATVAGLRESQVKTDTALRCLPPGVPRLGPPWKIMGRRHRETAESTSSAIEREPRDGSGRRTAGQGRKDQNNFADSYEFATDTLRRAVGPPPSRFYASIRSSRLRLPPRIASLSASVRNGTLRIRSRPSGQSYGTSVP